MERTFFKLIADHGSNVSVCLVMSSQTKISYMSQRCYGNLRLAIDTKATIKFSKDIKTGYLLYTNVYLINETMLHINKRNYFSDFFQHIRKQRSF